MKNKKVIIITSILLTILIIVGTVLIINNMPKKLETILENNEYKLESKVEKGTEIEGVSYPKDTYRYQKGEISLMVYKYNNLSEIKEGIYADYEGEKKSSYRITFEDEDNYIYKKSCDGTICYYSLGYDSELVSTIVGFSLMADTDEIFKEIMREKKLLVRQSLKNCTLLV